MPQMRREKKMKTTKIAKSKKVGLRSRSRLKGSAYRVSIVTEKGEELTYNITRRRGIYKIEEKTDTHYSHIRASSFPKVNSKISLYGSNRVVSGTIKKITALDPSTDVEPGDTPPIHRPGGH